VDFGNTGCGRNANHIHTTFLQIQKHIFGYTQFYFAFGILRRVHNRLDNSYHSDSYAIYAGRNGKEHER
jgi:hypothetical protein